MTTDNKDCSGCKWYACGLCSNPDVTHMTPEFARAWGNCEPSGVYYEPKEQQP